MDSYTWTNMADKQKFAFISSAETLGDVLGDLPKGVDIVKEWKEPVLSSGTLWISSELKV